MTTHESISDAVLQDYLDDRLDPQRRAAVAAWLAQNPVKAAELEALRYQDEALRALDADILEEPLPDRLREALRSGLSDEAGAQEVVQPTAAQAPVKRPRARRWLQAAAALAIFVVGSGLGWSLNSASREMPSEIDLVLSDASLRLRDLRR